jgi:RIO kinase 1
MSELALMGTRISSFPDPQVVLTLCAGMIHGDLSEYNVLIDADVAGHHRSAVSRLTPLKNNSAEALLLRDVENPKTRRESSACSALVSYSAPIDYGR